MSNIPGFFLLSQAETRTTKNFLPKVQKEKETTLKADSSQKPPDPPPPGNERTSFLPPLHLRDCPKPKMALQRDQEMTTKIIVITVRDGGFVRAPDSDIGVLVP